MSDVANGPDFLDEDDSALNRETVASFSDAVLYSSDWTVETVIAQLIKRNIDINPRFQRRDAWNKKQKSRFIESVIMNLPIPQIVLAEKKDQRGQYIVLDGKQRLLSLLQFVGDAIDSHNNKYSLSSLEARGDLNRKTYKDLQTDPLLEADLNAFQNHTIRTVVIRNWPSLLFLHEVFLRLNTGSVKLSPQELRQAVIPGEFSNFIDDRSGQSTQLQKLLSRTSPDPRMRDVELLVRYIAMKRFLPSYGGRMKEFLDEVCFYLNIEWNDKIHEEIEDDIKQLESAIDILFEIFGDDGVARKSESKSFNRAIFDSLSFYASDERIRNEMNANKEIIKLSFEYTLADKAFSESIESDTAGTPHTCARLAIWGEHLKKATGLDFNIPTLTKIDDRVNIHFSGLWN